MGVRRRASIDAQEVTRRRTPVHLWIPDIPIAEKLLRSVAVYGFLLASLGAGMVLYYRPQA